MNSINAVGYNQNFTGKIKLSPKQVIDNCNRHTNFFRLRNTEEKTEYLKREMLNKTKNWVLKIKNCFSQLIK